MTRWSRTVKAIAVVFVLAFPPEAVAATIFGAIQQGNQPVADALVVLVCGGTEAARTTTNAKGIYRLTTDRIGRCSLQVRGGSAEVGVYQDPTRYDFEIVGSGGQPRLNRR